MKNTILILSIFFLSVQTIQAQQGENKSFKDRTWYGAHVALGFGASSTQSVYTLGLAPMMGYRIIDRVSIGPRANVLYRHFRFRDFNGNLVQTVNVLDRGIGAFLRAEVYRQYFVQAELMYESIEQVTFNDDNIRINGANAYIGVGMNAGGQNPSMELMVTYDLNLQATFKSNLVNFRFGFTLFY